MTKYNFFIPYHFPSKNKFVKKITGHQYAYATYKKKHTKIVADVIRLTFRKHKTLNNVWITYAWVEKDRRRDPGNFVFNDIFIADGMVVAGLLKNDGWNIKGITHTWEVGKEPGVWVEIREV